MAETNSLTAKLEALLFIYGEPIDVKKAAQILGERPEQIKQAAAELSEALTKSGRGLALIIKDDRFQLITRPNVGPLLEKVVKAELHEALTPAAVETLAITAYGAPITRSEIDFIRGVNSSFILRSLLLRGLIERETDPHRANAFVYTPSFDFLKYLGLSKIEELPEYEKFRELAKNVRNVPVIEPVTQAPASSEVLAAKPITEPVSAPALPNEKAVPEKIEQSHDDELVDEPYETESDL